MQKKYLFATIYLMILFAFTGCSTKLTVTANSDSSTEITLDVDLGNQLVGVIRSLTSGISEISGNAGVEQPSLFDAGKIKESFKESAFSVEEVATPGEGTLFVKGNLSGEKSRASDFINCTEHSLKVTLSRNHIMNIVKDFPAETASYFDLLMAPVFTGEEMNAEEYRDLIASIYGEELAEEMDDSQVEICLVAPKEKKSAKKSFIIPLVEFFTLDEEKVFEISF